MSVPRRGVRSVSLARLAGTMMPCARPGCGHPRVWHGHRPTYLASCAHSTIILNLWEDGNAYPQAVRCECPGFLAPSTME